MRLVASGRPLSRPYLMPALTSLQQIFNSKALNVPLHCPAIWLIRPIAMNSLHKPKESLAASISLSTMPASFAAAPSQRPQMRITGNHLPSMSRRRFAFAARLFPFSLKVVQLLSSISPPAGGCVPVPIIRSTVCPKPHWQR